MEWLRNIGTVLFFSLVLPGGSFGHELGPEHGRDPVAQLDTLFRTVRVFALEEPIDNPIGEIRGFGQLPNGQFVILDGMAASLRLHDENGFLVRTAGGTGGGPGEFRQPMSLAIQVDGAVLVGDRNRIHRFSPELEFDTTFTVPGQAVFGVETVGERILASSYRRFDDTVVILDLAGKRLGSFHPFEPEIYSVPYWGGVSTQFVAGGPDTYFVSTSTLYPIRRYGLEGKKKQDFGFPPPSWIEPVRPKYGAFVGLNRKDRMDAWAHSFSVITSTDIYQDSLLIVTHGGLENAPRQGYQLFQRTLDVYNMSGAKIVEDEPIPGRILEIGQSIFFLTSEPPGPWFVRVAELTVPSDGKD